MKTNPSPIGINMVIPVLLDHRLLSWLPFYANSIQTLIVPIDSLSKSDRNTIIHPIKSALKVTQREVSSCFIQEPFIKTGFWDNQNTKDSLKDIQSGWFFVQTKKRIKYALPGCTCCCINGHSTHSKYFVRKTAPEVISDYMFPATDMQYEQSRHRFQVKGYVVKKVSEVTESEASLFGIPPGLSVGPNLFFNAAYEEMTCIQTFLQVMKDMGSNLDSSVIVFDVVSIKNQH